MKAKIWGFKKWIKETDPDKLSVILDDMLHECEFSILEDMEHHFLPYGYTKVWLLGESHLAVHTFPEHGKSYLELSSCNKEKQKQFVSLFKSRFRKRR